MKKILLTVLFLLPVLLIHAQINAIADTGDEVILYEDGTWVYVNDNEPDSSEIKLNEQEYRKSDRQTFLVKSRNHNFGIWINPREWTFEKSKANGVSEFQFQKKDEGLYRLFVYEKVEIAIKNLKRIAFKNAKSASPDINIVKEEYRIVNGKKVLMMQMRGTIEGMKFLYFGYYYSGPGGAIQLLSYTADNLFEDYNADMELFLNGLV